jgi:hypothetical protein
VLLLTFPSVHGAVTYIPFCSKCCYLHSLLFTVLLLTFPSVHSAVAYIPFCSQCCCLHSLLFTVLLLYIPFCSQCCYLHSLLHIHYSTWHVSKPNIWIWSEIIHRLYIEVGTYKIQNANPRRWSHLPFQKDYLAVNECKVKFSLCSVQWRYSSIFLIQEKIRISYFMATVVKIIRNVYIGYHSHHYYCGYHDYCHNVITDFTKLKTMNFDSPPMAQHNVPNFTEICSAILTKVSSRHNHLLTWHDHFFLQNQYSKLSELTLPNYVALVCERTIPTKRQPLVGEVTANFCEN